MLDNRAAVRCVSKPPSPQSSDYGLHDAAYQLISAKSLQVRWARGHRDPKKAHSLQDYQDRIGNELADCAARASGTVYYLPLPRPREHVTSEYPREQSCDAIPSTQVDCSIMPAKVGMRSTLDVMVAPPCYQPRQVGTMALGDTTVSGIWGTLGNQAGTMPKMRTTHGQAVQKCLLVCPASPYGWTHGRH